VPSWGVLRGSCVFGEEFGTVTSNEFRIPALKFLLQKGGPCSMEVLGVRIKVGNGMPKKQTRFRAKNRKGCGVGLDEMPLSSRTRIPSNTFWKMDLNSRPVERE